MAKPKSKPLKSVLKKRKEKRLVTKPARRRVKLEISRMVAHYAQKGV